MQPSIYADARLYDSNADATVTTPFIKIVIYKGENI